MTVQEFKQRSSNAEEQRVSNDILSANVDNLDNEKEPAYQPYRSNQDSENLLGRVLAGEQLDILFFQLTK